MTLDQLLAAIVGALADAFFGFAAKRIDTPTVVKDPAHDTAEDQWDKEYAAAVAAGLVVPADK